MHYVLCNHFGQILTTLIMVALFRLFLVTCQQEMEKANVLKIVIIFCVGILLFLVGSILLITSEGAESQEDKNKSEGISTIAISISTNSFISTSTNLVSVDSSIGTTTRGSKNDCK